MADLIDRETLLETIKMWECGNCNSYNGAKCRACPTADAIDYIETAPTAGAKKGEWIPVLIPTGVSAFGIDEMTAEEEKCSLCGETYWVGELKNYCPNCGADMRGDNPDE